MTLIAPKSKVSEPPAVAILTIFSAPASDFEPPPIDMRAASLNPIVDVHTHVLVDEFSRISVAVP